MNKKLAMLITVVFVTVVGVGYGIIRYLRSENKDNIRNSK